MARPTVLLLLLLVACTSTRKSLERATTYEHAGMLREAHTCYEDLWAKRPRVTEAHVGMKRTAQGLLDRQLREAREFFGTGDLQLGEGSRHQAVLLKQEMDKKGLDLYWDGQLDEARQRARLARSEVLLKDAEEAFRGERFSVAADLANESLKLDPTQREAEYLTLISALEPRYRQGIKALELELWREAYGAFKWVTDRDIDYKDAWQRLSVAKGRAAYTLAYVPLFNTELYTAQLDLGRGQVEEQLAANVQQAIIGLKDALIVLVDRDNTTELLAEQQRNMSGTFDDRYVSEAGKLLGARYVMTGRILRFDDILTKQMEVQMQLLDTESGRILLAEVIRVNKQEIARGAPRAQLLERAALRMALRLAEFDPKRK